MTPTLARWLRPWLLAATLLPLTLHAADYDVQDVSFPGAPATALYAINNAGHYVGAAKNAAGLYHAVYHDGKTFRWLDPAGPVGQAERSWAYAIDGHDDIVGAFIDASGRTHGFVRRRDDSIEVVDHPDAVDTETYGINGQGHLIGIYHDSTGAEHAYVRRNGVYESADLPGAAQVYPLSINERGDIVGEYIATPGTLGYGYLQRPGGKYRLFSAPGAAPEQTYYISINNRRTILGSYEDAAGNWVNFIRKGRRHEPFELPASFGATFASVQTLNDHGDIVGWYYDAAGVAHGFLAKR